MVASLFLIGVFKYRDYTILFLDMGWKEIIIFIIFPPYFRYDYQTYFKKDNDAL